jgi:hypothetical protein
MAARDAIFNNFRWKLTALLLAMLVWFVIKYALYRGFTGARDQIVPRCAVVLLKAADDPRVFHLDPPLVDVIVQSPKELTTDDLEVFVNLTTLPDVNTALKQVMVRASDSSKLTVVQVEPAYVTVERVAPAEGSVTNSFRKP